VLLSKDKKNTKQLMNRNKYKDVKEEEAKPRNIKRIISGGKEKQSKSQGMINISVNTNGSHLENKSPFHNKTKKNTEMKNPKNNNRVIIKNVNNNVKQNDEILPKIK